MYRTFGKIQDKIRGVFVKGLVRVEVPLLLCLQRPKSAMELAGPMESDCIEDSILLNLISD